jgi:hypothetical protein
MLLRTLLEDPDLRLVLLAGEDQLDRPIRAVYTTDLRDPRRYLVGGQLVLSSLMWWQDADDSEAFVSALADAEVAGLVSGTALLSAAPADLVDACRRHRVPLLEVPVDVSFASISDRVVLGVTAERGHAGSGRRELVGAVAAGAGLDEVLRAAAGELGCDCWVVSSTGRVVGSSGGELPSGRIAGVVDRFVRADRLPASTSIEDKTLSVFGAGRDRGERVAHWCLVFAADFHTWPMSTRGVADELRTAVALLRSRLDEGRRVAASSASAVLRLVMDGSATEAELGDRLVALGHSPSAPMWALACEAGDDPALSAGLLAELADELAPSALIGSVGRDAIAVLSGAAQSPPSVVDCLRSKVSALEPALGERRATLGVSGAVPVSGLRTALREARHARLLAEHQLDGATGRAEVVAGSQIAPHVLLLATLPTELRRMFRQQLLHDLHEYDELHQSDLLRTLRIFLDLSCSWSKTAARLHIHVNTLRYRIRRIEEISGKSLTVPADRIDLYLALAL